MGQHQLIVVSNRGPYRQVSSGGKARWVRSAGGLVAALDPVLRNRGGVWVSAEQADLRSTVEVEIPSLAYELASVKISRSVQHGFYEGVSNALLWPLLHSMPPTIRAGEAPWHHYVSANEIFAEGVINAFASSSSEAWMWVQDYQLMLVPGIVAAKCPRARIAWFCHVPWPSPEMFRILPWRNEVLEGLLGAHVLGFHTEAYAVNFLECVHLLTDYKVDFERMCVTGPRHRTRIVAAPIGISVNEVQSLAADSIVNSEAERLRHAVGDRRMILGVDRLDYTKGIPERIQAYEHFLRSDKSARDRFVFVQVMVPSRVGIEAYARLKNEVDRMIGDVNGRYSSTGRIPIHYLYRSLDQRALYAHYRAADVAFVTPLRDGMNLVAHEYIASRVEGDGVLVLSEFAGAATYMKDALQVNPYDVQATFATLRQALTMKPAEVKRRMQRLRAQVLKLDVHRWADKFLRMLDHDSSSP